MKTLYILISNGGDGSYYPQFTFDDELVKLLEKMHDMDIIDYDDGFADGDGFHYSKLSVPDEVTYQSLGVREMDGTYWKERYKRWMNEYGEEEDE